MPEITVSELWRYPVKSMRGERLVRAELTLDGVRGDRTVHVAGPRGLLTGRTRHGLLTVPATTAPDGTVLVDGRPWDGPEAAALVSVRGREGARLVRDPSPSRFDVLNLLVATDGAVSRLGHDVRRLRPNLVLAGTAAELEAELPGRALRIGEVVIGVHSLRSRCIVTTIDPDSGEQDLSVLRRIRAEFDGEVALNCWVIEPGTVTEGDPVMVVDTDAAPATGGGWVVGAPYPHAVR